MKYINAKDILPPELLAQVYEYMPRGGRLYLPRRTVSARIRRNLEIFQMHSEGKTITEISERMLIHRATVYRVLSQFVPKKRAG
ncbi:MAG TPA: helix-turn-helix domain-containing protein [bacterium]|nr:helix-turn-helix domain-containing protein [bacterium]